MAPEYPSPPPRPSYYVPPLQTKTHDLGEETLVPEARRALVLEDDADQVAVLTAALKAIPCTVTSVDNGADGLRHILAGDFDVIICDLVMPKLPGDRFFMAVERVRPHLCKRFIFMTGYTAEKRFEAFARGKGCLLLWKPFELHVLLEAVQTILRKTGSTPPAAP